MPTFTLAGKDLRLLIRDARAGIILLLMPLVFILILGLSLGEGFGQKPDDRLRVSVVNRDAGLPDAFRSAPSALLAGGVLGAVPRPFPGKPWSEVVLDDLAGTADIRIELIDSQATAEDLVRQGRRAAVLVFEPEFSERMQRCSFMTKANPPPLNPLYREGINARELGLAILRDPTQAGASAIIEQVAQVSLLRVVIPWMIGKAFERVGDEEFMAMMAESFGPKVAALRMLRPPAALVAGPAGIVGTAAPPGARTIPPKVLKELSPVVAETLSALLADDKFIAGMAGLMAREVKLPEFLLRPTLQRLTPEFQKTFIQVFDDERLLEKMAAGISFADLMTPEVRKAFGPQVQAGIQELFSNYNFRAKTWAGLTKHEDRTSGGGSRVTYAPEGSGLLKRGALRYQVLVPSYTVMFAFFLVLTVGWLFVAERRQGTLVRLRAAPLTRGQILLGKLIPCLLVSLFQGFFLLAAGKVVFGMSWGPDPLWLVPVVASTSLAAMGLAMLVASVARTETQVAIYGTLLVLVLAGLSSSMMPRELMPEEMRRISYFTPHAWALDAYAQLLTNPHPEIATVARSCLVLTGFGVGFLALAWWRMRLD